MKPAPLQQVHCYPLRTDARHGSDEPKGGDVHAPLRKCVWCRLNACRQTLGRSRVVMHWRRSN